MPNPSVSLSETWVNPQYLCREKPFEDAVQVVSVAEVMAAERDAVEARHELEQMMGERNVRQGELDDIARLVGVGVDAPYRAVVRGVERLREALSEALDAMVHRPVDSELFLSAIAHAAAALGRTEEHDDAV